MGIAKYTHFAKFNNNYARFTRGQWMALLGSLIFNYRARGFKKPGYSNWFLDFGSGLMQAFITFIFLLTSAALMILSPLVR